MASVKEFGRNTSFCGVLRKVMSSASAPMSCDEIAAHVVELWGRGFPVNPYEDVCLVYKFLKKYMDTEEFLDELDNQVIMVDRLDGFCVPISPDLMPSELNSVEEQIKRIKFKLVNV